jgi:hypothetical protein
VAEFFIETLVVLLAIFLWLVVVALLVRSFGVRLPLAPFSAFKRTYVPQALTFSKHVLVFGVLYFGCGMLIVTTLFHYLEWKYWHGSSSNLTVHKLLVFAVLWPIVGGLLYGLISWNGRSGKSAR